MVLRKKIIFVVLAVVVLGGLLIWLGPGFYNDYKTWQFTKQMNQISEELDKAKKDEYQAMMADTYGGKTPQETLRMYITAVEKGDYDLASKYFVREKQEKEPNNFDGASEDNLKIYLDVLGLLKEVGYSNDKKYYSMQANIDGPDFYAEFIIYPNGVWKISQI